jgi:hypothetical protein
MILRENLPGFKLSMQKTPLLSEIVPKFVPGMTIFTLTNALPLRSEIFPAIEPEFD